MQLSVSVGNDAFEKEMTIADDSVTDESVSTKIPTTGQQMSSKWKGVISGCGSLILVVVVLTGIMILSLHYLYPMMGRSYDEAF